jgi:hypothetical protein
MKVLETRSRAFTNEFERAKIGPRKAYRMTGVVVYLRKVSREMLIQWRCGDGLWRQGTFLASDEAMVVLDDGGFLPWDALQTSDLEQGDEVTIDYLPLGRQNLVFIIRCRNSTGLLRASNEDFCSSTAISRLEERKACA